MSAPFLTHLRHPACAALTISRAFACLPRFLASQVMICGGTNPYEADADRMFLTAPVLNFPIEDHIGLEKSLSWRGAAAMRIVRLGQTIGKFAPMITLNMKSRP